MKSRGDFESKHIFYFSLNGDKLFYSDQYAKKLMDFNFDEEIVKIRIERGEVPIKGDICVRAKIQSLFYKPK